MPKLLLALSALVFAAGANAHGWRALRIDGSSQASFEASVAAFQQELPWVKGRVFEMAMQDIWRQEADRAQAEQREYAPSEYFRQLDGLGYKEILRVADPTGTETKPRYRAARTLYAEALASQRPSHPQPPTGLPPLPRQVGFTETSMHLNNQGYPDIWPMNHP